MSFRLIYIHLFGIDATPLVWRFVHGQALLDDALWELIEPVLPPDVAKPQGGRPPLDNRRVLTGLIFVLKTGIPWEYLPQELGCGSGMTCWRRLRAWQQAGVWKRVHHILLNQLRAADRIDWSRAVVDSASVRAVGGGRTPVPIRLIGANRAASIM